MQSKAIDFSPTKMQCESELRNGYIISKGIRLYAMYSEFIDINVVNSKGNISTGFIRLPKKDIPALIKALDAMKR